MNSEAVKDLIEGGETTTIQFKRDVTNVTSIAQEMVAFANTKGGYLLIGVDDKTGSITGLSFQDIQRINSLLSTAAQEHVKSPILITTETVKLDENRIIVVTVPEGMDKPHTDKDGLAWVKNGADKRKVTSKEELSRLLQSSGNLYAEEMLIHHSTLADFNWDKFQEFYEIRYKEACVREDIPKHIENFRLGENGKINLAGALLFGKNVQRLIPAFQITAIWLWGNELEEWRYRASVNITGRLDQQYEKAYNFVVSRLDYLQKGQSFNSLGIAEVPEIVFKELIINALIHRDYFIQDSIKLFMFDNRIEIISPGKLPNSLTEELIKRGVRRSRNNIIASLAPELMEYRGAGSVILRSLQAYPDIQFFNDIEAEQFKVTIPRPPRPTRPDPKELYS